MLTLKNLTCKGLKWQCSITLALRYISLNPGLMKNKSLIVHCVQKWTLRALTYLLTKLDHWCFILFGYWNHRIWWIFFGGMGWIVCSDIYEEDLFCALKSWHLEHIVSWLNCAYIKVYKIVLFLLLYLWIIWYSEPIHIIWVYLTNPSDAVNGIMDLCQQWSM